MYQKSSLKKHNNDIPDHYHLDENQEVDQYSIGGYNPFIPQYHFKEIPVKMEFAPVYMIQIPNPSSYADNFDQNQMFFSYPPQPTSSIMEPLQIKQVKPRKQYKKKQQFQPTPQPQQLIRGDESEPELWQYGNYEIDKNDDERKFLFQQTLTGFVLKLFDAHQAQALGERYIVEQVRANISKLKRPDGTKYKGNLYKTVKGSLTSNGIFKIEFKKDNESFWVVCQAAAEEFQKRTIERIVQFTDKKKSTKKIKTQEDSISTKELHEHIKYDYAHAFGLLNGFLDSQPLLKRMIEQVDINDLERSRPVLRQYNIDQIQLGMKECSDFFSELCKKQKNEIIQH